MQPARAAGGRTLGLALSGGALVPRLAGMPEARGLGCRWMMRRRSWREQQRQQQEPLPRPAGRRSNGRAQQQLPRQQARARPQGRRQQPAHPQPWGKERLQTLWGSILVS